MMRQICLHFIQINQNLLLYLSKWERLLGRSLQTLKSVFNSIFRAFLNCSHGKKCPFSTDSEKLSAGYFISVSLLSQVFLFFSPLFLFFLFCFSLFLTEKAKSLSHVTLVSTRQELNCSVQPVSDKTLLQLWL